MDNKTASDFIADLGEAQKQVDKLAQSNTAKLENLARQGIPLGAEFLAIVKVEALVESLMTTEESKMIFAYNVEVKKKKLLDDVMAEIRQMQISQSTNKLIVPGR